MENLISVLNLVMENEDVKKSCYKPSLLFTSYTLVYASKESTQIQINLPIFENSQAHPGLLGYSPLKNNSSMQQTAINE